MKKHIILQLLIITIILPGANCQKREDVTKYKLPKNYSGWVCLLLTDQKEKIRISEGYVPINKDGFGYRLYGPEGMQLYNYQGREVSDQAKLISKSTFEHNGKEYEMFEFFIPDEKAKALGEEIWQESNPFLDSLQFQRIKTQEFLSKKYLP
jgi:hypothetical protein